jgi:hypothetical protein
VVDLISDSSTSMSFCHALLLHLLINTL